MNKDNSLSIPAESRNLTRAEFQGLADVPAELEWLANIDNANTRRAYMRDVREFMDYTGIVEPTEFRVVTRAHVIGWRKQLEFRDLAAATVRRKLSAVSSLYDFLCERNAIEINPTHGVKRPSEGTYEGKTPALGDAEAKKLLEAPPEDTLKGLRDRAILATYLFHGLRATELAALTPSSMQNREGVPHLRVLGKRSKIRFIPLHPKAQRLISDYLEAAGHGDERKDPLFRSVSNNNAGSNTPTPLRQYSLYQDVIKKWAMVAGLDASIVSNHAMRATAATNALSHEADIAKVQEWLGHANVSTTKLYDRRKSKPEDSPTFRIDY
ncbi:MAG: tyrosine-type recombinase/integrase [Verrucomicrobiaceae bacterium]